MYPAELPARNFALALPLRLILKETIKICRDYKVGYNSLRAKAASFLVPHTPLVKSITGRRTVEKFPEIKEDLWGGEFWSDGGYIGTVGDEVTATVIRNYILRQGSKEEKKGYKQFKISDF